MADYAGSEVKFDVPYNSVATYQTDFTSSDGRIYVLTDNTPQQGQGKVVRDIPLLVRSEP